MKPGNINTNNWINILNNQINRKLIHNALLRDLEENYYFGPHCHRNIEICLMLEGECDIIINGDIVTVHKNEFLVLFPHVIHSFHVREKNTCHFLQMHFYIDSFEDISPDMYRDFKFLYHLATQSKQYIKSKVNTPILNCVERIAIEEENRLANHVVLTNIYTYELILLLSREMEPNFHKANTDENFYVAKAINYIHENIEEKLRIDDIAEHCNISKRYLSTLFRENIKITTNDYITVTKLNYIMDYLSENNGNLTDVAYRFGFSSPQYFSTIFKKTVGVTPKEFMNLKSV